jgi:hypothetical protein
MAIESTSLSIFSCLPELPVQLEPSSALSDDNDVSPRPSREKRAHPFSELTVESEDTLKLQKTTQGAHKIYCELFNAETIPELGYEDPSEGESLPLISTLRKKPLGSFNKDLRNVLFLDKLIDVYEQTLKNPSCYPDKDRDEVRECIAIQDKNFHLSASFIIKETALPS